MHRSGAILADIAVICSKKTASGKALPQNPCCLGSVSCEITANMFTDTWLLFSVTGLNNGRIE
jgi:hypothetical protein